MSRLFSGGICGSSGALAGKFYPGMLAKYGDDPGRLVEREKAFQHNARPIALLPLVQHHLMKFGAEIDAIRRTSISSASSATISRGSS